MIQLYDRTEVNFDHNGHVLTDISNDIVTWQINSKFTLTFNYPIFSPFGSEIKQESIVTVPVPDGVQPFRIYSIQKSMGILAITAYHVFWDLQANWIEDINIVNETGADALQHIMTHTQFQNDFNVHSQLSNKASARIVRMNAINALIGTDDNTFLSRWGGEFEWDGFGFNVVGQIGQDRGVVFRNGKNLLGYTATENSQNVVTRIQPKGYNGLLLPEKYVDSPLINNYVTPKIGEIDYQNIKAKDKDTVTDDDTAVPVEEAYKLLREAAKKEFEVNHLDQPSYTFQLNVILLEQTEQYKDSMFTRVYPGDTATFIHDEDGLNVKARMTGYTWAPTQEQYLTVTFDSAQNLRPSPDLSQKIDHISDKVDTIDSDVVTKAAGGANSITWSSNPPSGDAKEGDLWYQQVGDKITMWIYQDGKWVIGVDDATGADIRKDVDEAMGEIADAKKAADDALAEAQAAVDDFNNTMATVHGDIDQAKANAANALNNVTVIDTKITNLSDSVTNQFNTLNNGYQQIITDTSGLKTQVTEIAGELNTKVDSDTYESDKTQTDKIISQTVSKVDGMNTQINQVANDVQIIASTSGLNNLVYNSGYRNNAEGWDLMGVGYLSTVPASSFNGSPGLGINVSGKKPTDFTQFAKSKAYKLPSTTPYANDTNNTYSAQAKIKYYTESEVGSKIIACFTYLDAKGARISGWKDMFVEFDGKNHDVWIDVKFENYGVPKGAVSVVFYYWGYGNVHGMVVEPMIVHSNKIGAYQSDSVNSAELDVAVDGIQTTVKNEVNNLQTQITQTNNTIQLAVGSSGSKNLVYNASFNQKSGVGLPDNWRHSTSSTGENAYWSANASSSYQGRGSIGINTNKEKGWVMFAESDPQPLAVDNDSSNGNNIYSASAMVKVYRDGGAKDTGHVYIVLAFYDENKKRIESNTKGVWSKNAKDSNEQWQMIKIEGYKPAANAKYVAIQAFAYQEPTHAMFNQPMINVGNKVEPFKPDVVNQASINESINNINLKVSNADGSSSQMNINNNTILLDANKIVINGNTSIKDATISSAKIASLSADKITAGTLNASKVNVVNLNAANIVTGTIKGANLSINLNNGQVTFQHGRIYNTAGNFDLNVDEGTLKIFNSTKDSGVQIGKGEMIFTESTLWNSDNPEYGQIKFGTVDVLTKLGMSVIGNRVLALRSADAKDTSWVTDSGTGGSIVLFNADYNSGQQNTSVAIKGEQAIKISAGDLGLDTPHVFINKDKQNAVDVLGATVDLNSSLGLMKSGGDFHLSNDGKTRVWSDSINIRTYSNSANVYVTEYGTLGRSTSASKYKMNIEEFKDQDQAHALLAIKPKIWYDKNSINIIVDEMNTGIVENEDHPRIENYLGFIAEDLANAGLEMLVVRGKDGQVESINYDRISALEHLNVQELFKRVLQLEKTVYELRSGLNEG